MGTAATAAMLVDLMVAGCAARLLHAVRGVHGKGARTCVEEVVRGGV